MSPGDPVAGLQARPSAVRRNGGDWPAPRQLARPRRLPGQEAREPGAGSRKTRLPAMSSTGAGSPLRMASRRESLPDR
jgi:hypothetical protein